MNDAILIGMLCMMALVIGVIYIKKEHDRQFGVWFEKVLLEAETRNMTDQEIFDIEELWFWDSYLNNLTPSEALTEYLKK